jgi:hypothetical protein
MLMDLLTIVFAMIAGYCLILLLIPVLNLLKPQDTDK